MRYEVIAAFREQPFDEKQWGMLIAECHDNQDLALASLIFYSIRDRSTHVFDYFVPEHFEYGEVPTEVQAQLERARAFVAVVKGMIPESNDEWFAAAKLVVALHM